MSKILIVLKLRRRSGVLASAVAALGRCGLEFRSQRISDDDGPRLDLSAEGQLSDYAIVVDAYAEVRGVAEVLDVLVDGQTLLHQAVPEEPALASGDDVGERTEDSVDTDVAVVASVPQADPAPQPEPVESPAVEPPQPVPESSAAKPTINGQDVMSDRDDLADGEAPETSQAESEEERRRRLRMVMRRRRRYY